MVRCEDDPQWSSQNEGSIIEFVDDLMCPGE